MTDQKAFEEWFRGEQGKPYTSAWDLSQAAFHAALAYIRSQAEPVAYSTQHYEEYPPVLTPYRMNSLSVPLYLSPQVNAHR